MANLPSIAPFDNIGSTTLTPVVVGLTNTLAFNASRKQVLYVRNGSASSVTLTLDGDLAPSTVKVPGTGATFNTATGATIPVAAGAIVAVPLGNYRAYMVGAVTLAVSAITDVTAWLVEV